MIGKLAALAAMSTGLFGLTANALAANCATITVSPATPSIPQWNPLNPTIQEATFTVTVTRVSSTSKSVRLIFLDNNSNATPPRIGSAAGPRYQIIDTGSGDTISYPSGTQISGLNHPAIQFGNGTNNTVTANMKVRILANSTPIEDFTGGNVFTETLSYAAACFKNNGNGNGGANGTDDAVASNLTLNLTIPKLASIVTATPATINFGNFTTTTQQAQVSVKSTSSLNVSASTTNTGKLVRSGAGASPPLNSYIPYSMKFNNVTLAPGSTLTNQARAGVLGISYPLLLTLTDGIPSGKLAGTYSDTITLTITPGL